MDKFAESWYWIGRSASIIASSNMPVEFVRDRWYSWHDKNMFPDFRDLIKAGTPFHRFLERAPNKYGWKIKITYKNGKGRALQYKDGKIQYSGEFEYSRIMSEKDAVRNLEYDKIHFSNIADVEMVFHDPWQDVDVLINGTGNAQKIFDILHKINDDFFK